MKRVLIGGIFFIGGAIMFATGDSFEVIIGMLFAGLGTIVLLYELFSKKE